MAWDEVQELLHYGALKEDEVKTVWEVSFFRSIFLVGELCRENMC